MYFARAHQPISAQMLAPQRCNTCSLPLDSVNPFPKGGTHNQHASPASLRENIYFRYQLICP